MKLGFAPSGRRNAAQAVTLAMEAERLGFSQVWVSEDYCERGAFTLAGAVAAATDLAQVGIGVVNPWTRHPVLLAMEAAALDEVARGRAVLGLGASNERWMGQLGIGFERPITVTQDCLLAIRDLLAGRHVQRSVCGYDIDTALSFTPARADVPLVMGVKGPRAIQVAAEDSDGILLSVLSSTDYVRHVRRGVGENGPGLSAYVIMEYDEDIRTARDRVRPLVARFLGVHGLHDITRVAGLPDELALSVRSRFVAGESAVDMVTDDLVDTFAIAGDEDTLADGLARFADAGLESLIVIDSAGAGTRPEQQLKAISRVAETSGFAP